MLLNGQIYFEKRFLKHVWPFYNIVHERFNWFVLSIQIIVKLEIHANQINVWLPEK